MYKLWGNKVTSLIKKRKRIFFNKAVENRSDQKILWGNLKTITNNDAPVQQIASNLCINDTLVEGTESVINEHNKYFANISNIIDRGPFDDANFKRLESHLKTIR